LENVTIATTSLKHPDALKTTIAKVTGRGFPTPDGYIAAIAASRGFIVAPRDTAPYEAARVTVINPWEA
jgi:toxin FitB